MKQLYSFSRIATFYQAQAQQQSIPVQVQFKDKTHTITKPSDLGKLPNALVAKLTYNDGTSELCDINKQITRDCSMKLLSYDDPQAQRVFWHSSAHILGAMLEQHYEAQLQFGPSTDNGFYYQCVLPTQHSHIGLTHLNDVLKEFLSQHYKFEHASVSREAALELFKHNTYKCNQIITRNLPYYSVYKVHNFIDLCRGPHIDNTSKIHQILVNHQQSYTQDQVKAIRYQGVSFPNHKLAMEYQKQQAELLEHDHRVIGKQQQLFIFHKNAPGSAFFLNHGTKIYNRLLALLRHQYRKRGYTEVITPQMYNKEVWQTSGHLDKYAENIYMTSDETMGIKPMNCPGHCLLFQMQQHSYKELPIRYADFGVLHRNEVHGSLSGLTRVRKFTQDDAHIFCQLDQIQQEITSVLEFLDVIYKLVGFTYELSISTRPDQYIGTLEMWEMAEEQLRQALLAKQLPFSIKDKDGAFYGPKIDVMIKDYHNKEHQCGTIQLDFNLPERFNLTYRATDEDAVGDKQGFQRPVMIHRAILGSIERMMAILTEQYKGKWPFWLSPRQVLVVNVSNTAADYATQIWQKLHSLGFEAELDIGDATLSKKIRKGELLHFNYIVIVGEKEQQNNCIDVRERGVKQHSQFSLDEFITQIKEMEAGIYQL